MAKPLFLRPFEAQSKDSQCSTARIQRLATKLSQIPSNPSPVPMETTSTPKDDAHTRGNFLTGDKGQISSLGDWFWEVVFQELALPERARAELVCQRWYGILRTWQFWEDLALGEEGSMAGKWDNSVIGQLVSNSYGPNERLGLNPPDWWPRPSPIKQLDLTGCIFRGVSPLRVLEVLALCPNLEVLKMSGMKSGLTGADLPFHSKDFVYIQEMICQFGKTLTALEIDAHVESTWSSHTPSKSLDPVSWAQLLDWLACPRSPVKIMDLEILEIPETVWEEAGDIGEVLIERPDASKENLQDLGCALSLGSSVDRLTFGSNCQLGDDGARVVVENMKGNQSVKKLSFQRNGITIEGVKSVVNAILRVGLNVVMLDVSNNSIDKAAAATALKEVMNGDNFRDFKICI